MNLTEALDLALPELPVRKPTGFPKLHPNFVYREQLVDGEPMIVGVISGKTWLYRFSPRYWELIELFDGMRSYQEISATFYARTGVYYSEAEVHGIADNLEEMEMWYRTPLEENVALTQKLVEERGKRTKRRWSFGDFARLEIAGWDPDRYFDWAYPKLKFVFTPWFTALTLLVFAFMTYVFIDRWDEILRDTIQFYNFREKTAGDIAQFWMLLAVLLFFHETAHGLAVKHYGGEVHRMGFHLVYLTPAFFVDCTEAWVYADRPQRIVTIVAGVWEELIVCAIATPIWWGTPPGTWAHEFAYTIILITGLGVIFFNWNPLIKLDGYYLLSEIVGITELKEKSTAYVGGWVKRKVFRLPVEVPYVPRQRRLFFVSYALLSGAYSYALLFFFARFVGNIFRNYNPEWYFVPALGVAFLLFRSRILKLVRFMNTLYLDKKDRVRAWFTPASIRGTVAAGLVLLLAPVWRETVDGRFLLEPAQRAVIRAAVPGAVVEVSAEENQRVAAGTMLVRLQNLKLESEAARGWADFQMAAARATEAQLTYASFGPAERERQRLAERSRTLSQQAAMLRLTAPVSGVVVTPRVSDLLGRYLEAGTEILEVADLSTMRARIYVAEFAVRKTAPGASASLHFDGLFGVKRGSVVSIAPASVEMAAGLAESAKYMGMRPPPYYVATIEVPNDGSLRHGMAGTARIYGERRSLAGFGLQAVRDFVQRKLW